MPEINPIGAAATSAASKTAATGLAANFETFMSLLTAQLKSQDPLSPLDTKDFTNQLVQFTGVEQQLRTNSLLESLATSLTQNAGAIGVSYLGKIASAHTHLSAIQDGSATWNYEIPQNASQVDLKIFDSNNRLVRTLNGDLTKGEKTLSWDGVTNNGDRLNSGEFRLEVEAKAQNGENLTIHVSKKGLITDVDLSGNEPRVRIGGTNIALSAIDKIGLPTN